MRRAPITVDDICRWKNQGLGLGQGAAYKPWIDVRCFSSKGRMSRPPGVTTGRVHHLFSDNESYFFLMADYAIPIVDIREQFPLFPETRTQAIASALGIRYPKYPQSATPIVMTTDFLLTVVSSSGARSYVAWSIKSPEELRGKNRRSVLAKLELERRYWFERGVPWRLFTANEFDQTVIDNLDWLSYLTVEDDTDDTVIARMLPKFLARFAILSSKGLILKELLHACAESLGADTPQKLTSKIFRYSVWHHLIELDLRVPVGLQRVPSVVSVKTVSAVRVQ
ncbi:TnsA endonuclease N-terminal domain-containing protein [Janthinobacterium sp. GW460P]|uniref:TnsA endonuclease N-terminal domain-containing protein n=1 Tax=unclassified Janthinobacterium TaxID=2610881 RepID=UPI000A3287EB|nr:MULTISPECIES: TnsA endonuclease N-terminal domain-containing protein [unclassified Janthinobacterium]MCC7703515.1 TnsA endonuclease N-terminal domain-containing protein [Janthinobacterium sp. GW460P]MCC7709022.1 TnsA endonuclease N-terminal domain-containing protein [Janthinobacterium sp. GW460W]